MNRHLPLYKADNMYRNFYHQRVMHNCKKKRISLLIRVYMEMKIGNYWFLKFSFVDLHSKNAYPDAIFKKKDIPIRTHPPHRKKSNPDHDDNC